jgi:threonine dehydrogenase-like Zn-dependent dehydrogenase
MRATVYHGPGDMHIDQVPDPIIQAPTDVVARITNAGICGSDLWSYRGIDQRAPGDRMGRERRLLWHRQIFALPCRAPTKSRSP